MLVDFAPVLARLMERLEVDGNQGARVDHDGGRQSRCRNGVWPTCASSFGTIVAGGGVSGLPPGVVKMRIVPQKEDETDVYGHIEGSQGAATKTSPALMESGLAGQPGQEFDQE
jgi:hypothetical protein